MMLANHSATRVGPPILLNFRFRVICTSTNRLRFAICDRPVGPINPNSSGFLTHLCAEPLPDLLGRDNARYSYYGHPSIESRRKLLPRARPSILLKSSQELMFAGFLKLIESFEIRAQDNAKNSPFDLMHHEILHLFSTTLLLICTRPRSEGGQEREGRRRQQKVGKKKKKWRPNRLASPAGGCILD